MKSLINKAIMRLLPRPTINFIQKPLRDELRALNGSYSQNGEDILLHRIFQGRERGFFIDVGAHHPVRFSNTYGLYKKGWRGINIDAMPGSMNLFNKLRPEDTNIEVGISRYPNELTYYCFNEPALNTFSSEEAGRKDGTGQYKIVDKIRVLTEPLSKILDEHIKSDHKEIDFFSIDVEGLDLEVLESNDWDKYRPNVIVVESNTKNIQVQKTEVYQFLSRLNYSLISVLFNSLIFVKDGACSNYIVRI